MSEPTQTPEPNAAELADAVRELRETVTALRDEARLRQSLPPELSDDGHDPYEWVSLLEAPRRKRPAVPRLALEALFLVACAVAVGIADLDAAAIAGVMVGAWALVSLIELAASRADRAREEILWATPPIPAQIDSGPPPADPAWYSPPAEHTMLDVAEIDATALTRLPPRVDDLESTHIELADATIEQRPTT